MIIFLTKKINKINKAMVKLKLNIKKNNIKIQVLEITIFLKAIYTTKK